MLNNFRTFQLSISFYHSCQKIKVPTHLRNQLDRSSSSITLNLGEGYGKPTYKDQKKYFSISMGSLRECQAILILSGKEDNHIYKMADQLGAYLYKLINFRGNI